MKYLFLFLFILVACEDLPSRTSSRPETDNVDIFIQPNGERPQISLGKGNTQICRRGVIPADTIHGLEKNEIQTSNTPSPTPTNNSADPNTNSNTNTNTIKPRPEVTEVGENWFKMGLLIVNKRRDYWLVIEQLKFIITANWGNKLLRTEQIISSGYCKSEYLYIIAPTPAGQKNSFTGNIYQPHRYSTDNTYINNLTLYVSGVPIPTEHPVKTIGNQQSTAADNTINSITRRSNPNQQLDSSMNEPFILTYLPPYKVQLIIIGRWIDKKRNDKGYFSRLIKFNLTYNFIK